MAVSAASSVAYTGLSLESTRLAVTANNVANLQTDGFKPSRVLSQDLGNGVIGYITPSALDGVDLVTESVSLITALRAFEANASVIRTDDEMVGSLLDRFA
jgi:flagellar basal-body rod protein FlgC